MLAKDRQEESHSCYRDRAEVVIRPWHKAATDLMQESRTRSIHHPNLVSVWGLLAQEQESFPQVLPLRHHRPAHRAATDPMAESRIPHPLLVVRELLKRVVSCHRHLSHMVATDRMAESHTLLAPHFLVRPAQVLLLLVSRPRLLHTVATDRMQG